MRNQRELFTLKICAQRNFIDGDGNRGGPWFPTLDALVEQFQTMPIPNVYQPSATKQRPIGVALSYPIEHAGVAGGTTTLLLFVVFFFF